MCCISVKKNRIEQKFKKDVYKFGIIDEIKTYNEKKLEVEKEDGSIVKYALGTNIWTILLIKESGEREFYAIAKDKEKIGKQFKEILENLPKIEYMYSDNANFYSNAEETLLKMLMKSGLKYRSAIDLIPIWTAEKNRITNVIEGFNNAVRNGVSSIKRRCSGPARNLESLQVSLDLVCERINRKLILL
jgi:hypothetical protein